MFRVPRANVIESDEDFSIEILGITGLRYRQGDRALFVNSEILASTSPFFLSIIKRSIQHWDPPYDGELIDEATRELIVENICRAFASQGNKVEVIY
jgi:hypothetical protein